MGWLLFWSSHFVTAVSTDSGNSSKMQNGHFYIGSVTEQPRWDVGWRAAGNRLHTSNSSVRWQTPFIVYCCCVKNCSNCSTNYFWQSSCSTSTTVIFYPKPNHMGDAGPQGQNVLCMPTAPGHPLWHLALSGLENMLPVHIIHTAIMFPPQYSSQTRLVAYKPNLPCHCPTGAW